MLARGWNKGIYKKRKIYDRKITCAINRVEEQIEQLFDEKEEFIMAYEDALPRTMYLKKLTEIDSRIDELKKTLISLNEEKQEILDME